MLSLLLIEVVLILRGVDDMIEDETEVLMISCGYEASAGIERAVRTGCHSLLYSSRFPCLSSSLDMT